MNHDKKAKRALITGCSSGFGLKTAVSAAQAGYDVIATVKGAKKGYLETANIFFFNKKGFAGNHLPFARFLVKALVHHLNRPVRFYPDLLSLLISHTATEVW